MIQLILHLLGDYVFQTDWMAKNKGRSSFAAGAHALAYSVPFLFLPIWLNDLQQWLAPITGKTYTPFETCSLTAFLVILLTHFFIDRYGLARYVVYFKNWTTQPSLRFADCSATGYHKDTPPWLAVMLLIVADNTLHLLINFLALKLF